MTASQGEERGLNRRSFIRASAGVATGATVLGMPTAAVLGVPAAAAALEGGSDAVEVAPSSAAPAEPLVAYVHDARKGEVTVLAGTREATFRDPALVKRLLAISPADPNGGADVVAS
jgi:hypothetical protein